LKDTFCQIQTETHNLYTLTSIKEVEPIIGNFLKLEAPGPNGLTGKFY
jgi:hypothetical protein